MPEPLGQLQLQVMEIVWRLGRATVAQVHEVLAGSRKIAYTTVLTTMRALERRGIVRHEQVGKAYVYEPLVSREEYAATSVHRLLDDLFDGSREKLLCHLLGADRISQSDLAKIRRAIRRRRGDTS